MHGVIHGRVPRWSRNGASGLHRRTPAGSSPSPMGRAPRNGASGLHRRTRCRALEGLGAKIPRNGASGLHRRTPTLRRHPASPRHPRNGASGLHRRTRHWYLNKAATESMPAMEPPAYTGGHHGLGPGHAVRRMPRNGASGLHRRTRPPLKQPNLPTSSRNGASGLHRRTRARRNWRVFVIDPPQWSLRLTPEDTAPDE